MADGVGAADDHAPRRLAEDVGELGDRHGARRHELGERLAGADRRELVGVADEHDVRARADGAQQRDEQLEVGHRGLVDDQEVAPRARRRSGPGRGSSRARSGSVERVEARSTRPSAGRRGRSARRARPTPSARAAAAQSSRIVAVLPVPGPPVTIERRDANAARTAAHCSGAGTSVVGAAARRAPQPGFEPAELAHLRRELGLERRGRRPVGPDRLAVELEHERRSLGHRAAGARRRGAGAQQRRRPRVASSATGRQVEPSRSASASTCTTPARGARGRVGADARRPGRSCRPSAKPTPNTLVSSYGLLAHDVVRALAVVLRRSAARARRARAARAAGAARGSSAGAFHERDRLRRAPRRSARPRGTRRAGRGRSPSSTSSP